MRGCEKDRREREIGRDRSLLRCMLCMYVLEVSVHPRGGEEDEEAERRLLNE